jgi:ribokinase
MVVAKGFGLSAENPIDAAQAIASARNMACIVTLGSEGAVGWTDGVRRQVPAPSVTVVDTTAAGDAFCGAFAAALDQGFGFTGALGRGVTAGSLACTIHGAQPSLPTKVAIEDALKG